MTSQTSLTLRKARLRDFIKHNVSEYYGEVVIKHRNCIDGSILSDFIDRYFNQGSNIVVSGGAFWRAALGMEDKGDIDVYNNGMTNDDFDAFFNRNFQKVSDHKYYWDLYNKEINAISYKDYFYEAVQDFDLSIVRYCMHRDYKNQKYVSNYWPTSLLYGIAEIDRNKINPKTPARMIKYQAMGWEFKSEDIAHVAECIKNNSWPRIEPQRKIS